MKDKHTFASPGPAGLIVLAFYLGGFFPLAAKIAPHDLVAILVVLGFVGGIVQLIAGVIELHNGAILPGNLLCAFSGFMFLGMGENLLKVLNILPGNSAPVDGYVFLIMGIIMVAYTPPFLYKNFAGSVFMITTDIFFCFAAFSWLFDIPLLFKIAAWDIPFVICSILWQVIAEVYNEIYDREVISLGRPILKVKKS